jgi:hypothetical protein
MHHERLKQFHCRSIEKAREAGIPAYLLDGQEGVLRILPNGQKERIVISEGRSIVHPVGHMQPQHVTLG